MLPFDFDYYRPETLQEALALFQVIDGQGRRPVFFSGGTELITLGRIGFACADAVIDIKNIREFRMMQEDNNQLVLGSALSLSEVADANLFPLLSKTASEVADHTAREKITLGGNICAQIYYREAVLPFLLADSNVVIAGPDGMKTVMINEIFHQELLLQKGEVLVEIATNRNAVEASYISIKRRQQWETGYPLITIAAMKLNGELRIAISGLCPFPFRSKEMERHLNDRGFSVDERIKRALNVLPDPILNDVEGSGDYRIFVLKHLLFDIWNALGSGGV